MDSYTITRLGFFGIKEKMMASDLCTAIISGQYDLAYQMVFRGESVNVPLRIVNHDPLMTLLHYAVVQRRDAECIRVLANLGANVNARDSKKQTPLHWAVRYNVSPDVVEMLIEEGAFVDPRDEHQKTPLHYAVINNYIESAEKLIARGACINAVGMHGTSVLHEAVRSHNLEMVILLISHGVMIDAKDICGDTPLLSYMQHRRLEDNTQILQHLLDNGADVNSKSHNSLFSLFYAAKFNRLASLHLLLKSGARVNKAIITGNTALHVACMYKLDGVTALLLEFGADLNARNREGKTPFELLPYSPTSKATAQIIIKEAVKREASGQFLCGGYKLTAQLCDKYSKFEQECRQEIKQMQREKIGAKDSPISFFYILSKDEENIAVLVRNEKFVKAFESSKAPFRIYAAELAKNFEAAKKRANFLLKFEDCLDEMLGGMLPAEVVQKIASYIKYDDVCARGLHNDCD